LIGPKKQRVIRFFSQGFFRVTPGVRNGPSAAAIISSRWKIARRTPSVSLASSRMPSRATSIA